MISYRLRGLVNLHVLATTIVAVGYFLLMVHGIRYIPFIQLNPDLNLLLYVVVIFFGMLGSGRYWNQFGSRFHIIQWVDAAYISARQIVVVALLVFTLIVATKDAGISRLFLAVYLLTCWIVLFFANRYFPGWLARAAFHQMHQIPTLFVGPARSLSKLAGWIKGKEHLGIRPVGVLTDEPFDSLLSEAGPRLGQTNQLAEVIEIRGVGQVVLLEVSADPSQMILVLEVCQNAGCRLLIYHDLIERLPLRMSPVMEENHLFFTAQEEPLEDPFNRVLKRTFDIAVALPVVAVILPPLCLLTWAIQCLQAPGPLLFARVRGGHRRREFFMLKFRSMYAARPDYELEARQASLEDPRIYPFGHFMRRTSLDEFPQFWNVLVGEMSIVGPRPHLPKHDEEFSRVAKTYRTRQLVKPGITGLAQVSGYRGEITDPQLLEHRVQLDIEYITRWSIWLDIQITLKTITHVFAPPKTAR